MHQYVYFYIVDYEKSKNKNENEVFKRVELNGVSKDLYGGYNPFGMQQRIDMNNGNYVVPEGVTTIGNDCFYGCTSLTSVQLPSTLINIGEYAFSETNIKSITIPEGVTSIGKECFNGCSSLTTIELP